ncbi:MAG: hypothetical protein R3F29_10595 [Planctomycetota bacterium]
MPLLALLPLLLFAVLAMVIGRDAMARSRRLRAEGRRHQPRLRLAAIVLLGLVVSIAVGAVLVAPYSMDSAGAFGCVFAPAQIGLLTLASGMLVLANAESRGRESGDGCAVAVLWLITFGIGACYASLLSGGIPF